MVFTEIFNNREISSIILLSLFIIYAFYKIDDRQGLLLQFYDIFLQFFQKKFLIIQFYFMFYIFIELVILHKYFYWNISLLKDTIIWIIAAYFLIMKHSKLVEKKYFIRTILFDTLKFIAIYEFIVNLYTFNFIFEFIMTTIITLLILMQTVMKYEKQESDIKLLNKVVNFILVSFTIVVIYLTINSIYNEYQNIVVLDQVKKFFLPFLLTLLYLPFYYLVLIIIKYESIFVIIDLYQKNNKLKIYTKIKIIMTCFMSYDRLKIINLKVYFLSKSNSKNEIKLMLNDIIINSEDT